MAYCYLDRKDRKMASWCLLEKAIPLALKHKDDKLLANLYDSHADVLIEAGDGISAAKYLKKSLESFQNARIKEVAEQTRLLMALLDVKNKEITIREHETRLMVQGKNIQRLWIMAFAFALLALISLLFAWVTRLRGRVRIQQKETEHTRRLLELETGEKQRVAMQLHDLIGPVRNILLKQIGEVETTYPAIGASLRVQLTDIASALRSLSHRMNSAMLDQLTLGEAVEALRHDFIGMPDSKVTFEMDPDCSKIQGKITGHLFFILLELMTNAAKYCADSHIHISVTFEFGNLYLIYRDDGPGFTLDENTGDGMGLSNIRNRAAILNGLAHLESIPGKGTTWTISIPHKSNELSIENTEQP